MQNALDLQESLTVLKSATWNPLPSNQMTNQNKTNCRFRSGDERNCTSEHNYYDSGD